jgi:hypothetical protein
MRMAAGKGLTTPALMASGWTRNFTDPSLRRLTFGGNIIETGTDSYRLAHARAGQQARQRKACGHPGAGAAEIERSGGNKDANMKALDSAVRSGLIQVRPEGRGKKAHYLRDDVPQVPQ